MDFTAFDTKKMDEYAARAKEAWGNTEAYKEFEEKTKNKTDEQMKETVGDLMKLFVQFGEMKNQAPDAEMVQGQVKKLQDFITEHYYHCTDEILAGLGKMYSAGGEMTENINKTGGEGTAQFVSEAIAVYCNK